MLINRILVTHRMPRFWKQSSRLLRTAVHLSVHHRDQIRDCFVHDDVSIKSSLSPVMKDLKLANILVNSRNTEQN